MADKKMLPVGVDIFSKLIRQGFYYVDKTGIYARKKCSQTLSNISPDYRLTNTLN